MDFFAYFTKVEAIVQLIEFLFFGVISIILFAKTGNTKALNNLLSTRFCDINKKEENEMKYRTENYQEKEKVEGQKFDNLLKTYRLNKVTGELEDTGETIDIQEMINSSLSTCMTEVLSKFFPDQSPVVDDKVALFEEMQDDLDYLQDTFAVAEKYRDMYNLDPAMSVQQIFDFINTKSKELNQKLFESNAKKEEVVPNENAKETIEESK